MNNRKPLKIRSNVDDMKLLVIEHLTGERVVRQIAYSETLPLATLSLAVFALTALVGVFF
ncbi:MAG: hypothetical protein AAF692_06305 [Pseudomonadota bacterium]